MEIFNIVRYLNPELSNCGRNRKLSIKCPKTMVIKFFYEQILFLIGVSALKSDSHSDF